MKYIVLQVTDYGDSCTDPDLVREVPVVFPEFLVHAEVALAITAVLQKQRARLRTIEPVSGGFLSSLAFEKKEPFCHGESTSMGVKSRPRKDSELIVNYDYFHGMTV